MCYVLKAGNYLDGRALISKLFSLNRFQCESIFFQLKEKEYAKQNY